MRALTAAIICLSAFQVFGQSVNDRLKHYNIKKNIGLGYFDPVSYFDHSPQEGKEEYTFTHKGITYWFISQKNQARFKQNPEMFEPAYGGWCAYAMGETGEKVKVDPETYKILDGKLYLFYNFWGNNTLTDWNKAEKKLKVTGDANWKKIVESSN